MSSDESEFSVSYGSSGSEGSREETDEDDAVVCNQSSDVTTRGHVVVWQHDSKTIFERKMQQLS